MKQITEDYVSYKSAVLLKEKGFDEYCLFCYEQNVFSHTTNFTLKKALYRDILIGIKNSEFEENAIHNVFTAPSQSHALKWLREVHNIFIDIMTYTTGSKIQFRWVGYDKGRLFSQEEGRTIYFESYEQAVEAACLYVLKNLI